MGFNLLGAIGGAVGGFFTGGPVGANPPAGANPLLPALPPAPDTITSQLGQGRPTEDLTSAFDPAGLGDLSADSPGAMASVADYS